MAANPLSHGAPPRKHPRMLPDGTREAMLDAVRTARDRMIVTWLSDSKRRHGGRLATAVAVAAVLVLQGYSRGAGHSSAPRGQGSN